VRVKAIDTVPAALRFSIQFGLGIKPEQWPLSVPRMRRMIAASLPAKCKSAEITLLIAANRQAQALNRDYRNKDYATNILTFAYQGLPDIRADLVICRPVAAREAKTEHRLLEHHLAHLLVHGVLHASGLDHEEEGQAQAMESLEIAILKRFRIPNPYLSTGP
jgi:probable rRNA maturation factor